MVAKLLSSDLAADEFNYQLDLVAVSEEFPGFGESNIVVVLGDKRGKANLFDILSFSLFLAPGIFLLELIFEFGKINDFGYWRFGVRGDLN